MTSLIKANSCLECDISQPFCATQTRVAAVPATKGWSTWLAWQGFDAEASVQDSRDISQCSQRPSIILHSVRHYSVRLGCVVHSFRYHFLDTFLVPTIHWIRKASDNQILYFPGPGFLDDSDTGSFAGLGFLDGLNVCRKGTH